MIGPTTLTDIAARINAAHDTAHGAARTAIEHTVECGRLLLEARASIAHGEWLPWIEANLSFGPRQVQKYLRIAKHAEKLSNATSNSHLTIDGALRRLAAPKDETPALDQEPWWSATAAYRAQSCRQWPDLRFSYCLYLHVAGKTEAHIADRLGLDVREVEQALYPMPQPVPSLLATEVALDLLATWRANAAYSAQWHARRDGRTDLLFTLKYIARDAWTRSRKHSERVAALAARLQDEADVEYQIGITCARAAAGLEAIHPDWRTCLAMHRRIVRCELSSEANARESDLRIPSELLGEATFEDLVAEQARILAHRLETMGVPGAAP